MKILALDPAKGCTGWAVLEDDGSPDGAILGAGTIKVATDGRSAHVWLGDLAREVLALHAKERTEYVAIETPSESSGGSRSRYANRAATSMPVYGMAVGCVIAAVNTIEWEGLKAVVCVPVDHWARYLKTGGKHKPERVRVAAMLYGREVREFGTKSDAGNVADAVILARWVLLNKVRRFNG